jgi:cytochrome c oxidase subunit 1
VAVGTLVGVGNYFGTLYIAHRDRTYEGSVPLVVFGATAAAIIAVVTLLHGAVVMIPTFLWSLGWIGQLDASWYRITRHGVGVVPAGQLHHGRPAHQPGRVPRRLRALHPVHQPRVGPPHPGGSGRERRLEDLEIWNTSYAMYLAVLASMIHGFTVPAGLEVAMRKRGHNRGIFGWLTAAPWSNPAFSGFFLSLVIFGFGGGITGVVLGTQQINIMAHNTLRIPGHFHVTVVGGTTLAFMALTYYVVPLIFQKEFYARTWCRIQPYIFGGGITLMAIGMSFAGSYGVPRRHWDIEFTGAQFATGFDSGAHVMLGLMGIGAVIAFIGLLLYILLTVAAVFFGRSNAGRTMKPWSGETPIVPPVEQTGGPEDHHVPGTMVLVSVFLLSFAVYYFANWKWLADVWQVR